MLIIFRKLFLPTGDVVIGVRERTVMFRVYGEKVMFDTKSISNYLKEIVGCFIIQVLDNANEKAMMSELNAEPSLESHYDYMYNSPYIWNEAIEDCGIDEDLIEEICLIANVKEKRVEFDEICEGVVSELCPIFDKEDCNIIESIDNMVEWCYLFEGQYFSISRSYKNKRESVMQ